MAQHTPKVDPMSKLVGFVSALILLVAVFYLVNALVNTVDENSLEGQVVEKPESKEATKTAKAESTGGSADQGGASSGGSSAGGDVAAGKAKFATCQACHGADGKGQGGAFPALTGLSAAEAKKRLTAYREGDQEYLKSVGMGDRYGTMAPNAANLSDDDIANLAAYIGDAFGGGAGGESAGGNGGGAVDGDVAAGEKVFASCQACHGADGKGQGGAFPALTGLDAAKVQKALTAYRDGDKEYLKSVGLGDRYATMAPNAANLSDDDIANVAVYIADKFGGTNGGGGQSAGGDQDQAQSGNKGGEKKSAEPTIVAESTIKHGKALFSNCSICHGEKGEGGHLFGAPKLAGMSMSQAESLLKIYRKGQEMGPNSYAMIPQAKHLSDEDIEGVAAYIATLEETGE